MTETVQIQYQEQKGRYHGGIDPKTKLRIGSGTYTYSNPFFQYQGEWHEGKKHGRGALLMRDGSHYEGDFLHGEMTGKGVRQWEDGTVYRGDFVSGEKHGHGEIQYGRLNFWDLSYAGTFSNNQRCGYGELVKRDKTVVKGQFEANHPNGECEVTYPLSATSGSKDHDRYEGHLKGGIPQGTGNFTTQDGFSYEGKFEGGKRQGQGVYYIDKGTFRLQASFIEGEPECQTNKFSYELVSPILEAEHVDPKAKQSKGPVAASVKFTEDEEAKYPNRIYYEYRREAQSEQNLNSDRYKCPELSFTLRMLYQAPDFEDPNPPEEVVEVVKGKKPTPKGSIQQEQASIAAPRMITPDPVLMDNELGRVFRIELGRWEQLLVPEHSQADVDELKQAGQDAPEDWFERKWIRAHVNQQASDKLMHVESKAGECNVSGLSFRPNDPLGAQTVKSGAYELTITDVTRGLPARLQAPRRRILLKLVDLEQEEEKVQQAAAVGVKGGGKKK